MSKLETGRVFSKIDLAHAYQQLELDEQSKPLTTITTHKSLFRYNRLSFGIASAPGLFQGVMEKVLSGLDGELSISTTFWSTDDQLKSITDI